ncbi:4-alpha-glucanotransferase [Cellulomonas persica]|uniref:4-alpha-glucanotransferase n=1 Tax=Cellulomonas persica TaxID=76861 RepID=A0A510UU86_9CELL|nr:4-alpha-glucanotransferase [Cellulomonas persica]GEK16375.1 4-alpha-glucanotransferase [Cellulomonas persica]
MVDDSPAPSDALLRLAAAHGVVPDHWGFHGDLRRASADTLCAVLAALGVDASSPERIELALAHVDDMPWRRVVPPTTVVRSGREQLVPVHVTHGDPVHVWLELDVESGGGRRDLTQADVYVEPRTVDGRLVGRATFVVPGDLPLGWHSIHASGPSAAARGVVVVTPDRLELPAELAEGRAWGYMAQLYSVRSRRSWGVGDLADLADLGWLAAHETGADFLLINPLHAAEPVAPLTPSPYLPSTRRFVNPIYVRPEAIAEAAYLSAADRSLVEWAAESVLPLDLEPGPIDRDAAWTAKRTALDVIHAHPRSQPREAQLAAFVEEQGPGLRTFALWCALAEKYGAETIPDELADPSSPAVAAEAQALADRVDFFVWLQWVADEQLAAAQRAAREGGMSIGIMHDLAVGVHPAGADVWSLGDVLARGATVGAPPDMYNQQGQDWSQPPWRPDELARAGYAPYRDMLRTVLRHAGAIRIDHVIGLFRLWWVPEGNSAKDGAYVRYDHEALVGILALEAHRAGAIVIGEDLGTVEPWVRDYLSERGILGTSVLWFESGDDGNPLPPEHYRRLVLATVTTHDLPPSAGYLAGEHVAIRERLGLLTDPVAVVRAQADAERDRMLAALRSRGLLGADPSEREVVEALHRYVMATPSVLIGVALADAVGERRAQNQPGTDQEYPNWKVPLADSVGQVVLVDDLFANARLRSLAAVLDAQR